MVALLSAYESEEKPKFSVLESMGLGFGWWWEREREREKIRAKEKNIFYYVDI